jgi:hypothetical protein
VCLVLVTEGEDIAGVLAGETVESVRVLSGPAQCLLLAALGAVSAKVLTALDSAELGVNEGVGRHCVMRLNWIIKTRAQTSFSSQWLVLLVSYASCNYF